MKRRSLIIIVFVVMILTWLGTSLLNVRKAQNREGIVLSPNKSKSVEFINAIGTSQILMNFHKTLKVSGSYVTSGNFNENEIILKWEDENTLLFEYPKGTIFNNKKKEVYSFGETVNIKYKELIDE